MDKIIVDGCVTELQQEHAAQAYLLLENAVEGNTLVALSYTGDVLVRWIDEQAAQRIVFAIHAKDVSKNTRSIKPTKKLCPWLFVEVESYFDQVAAEHNASLEMMHINFNENLEQNGKRPESFRRWISKIRKRWVKTVVENGKQLDDLRSLVVY